MVVAVLSVLFIVGIFLTMLVLVNRDNPNFGKGPATKVVQLRGRANPNQIARTIDRYANLGYDLISQHDNTGGFGGFYGVTLTFRRRR